MIQTLKNALIATLLVALVGYTGGVAESGSNAILVRLVASHPYRCAFVDYGRLVSFREVVSSLGGSGTIIINGTFFDPATGKLAFAPFTRNLNGFYGVTLVADGEILYHPTSQGYRTLNTRSFVDRLAVGFDRAGNLNVVCMRAPLYSVALYMWTIGCKDAVALDGGSSVGIYQDYKIIKYPSREITNVYIIKEKKDG
jgi:exopolysaccharide biosynthesis protein